MPASRALTIACPPSVTRSLVKMFETWLRTAFWLSQMGKKLVDARREEKEIRKNALFFILNL